MRIEQALEKFMVQLRADGRSPHTIGQYRRHIRTLAHWLADVGHSGDVREIGHEAVARFLGAHAATRRPDGRAKTATSINCLRSSLKGFFGYLHGAGYIRLNPGRLIRRAICASPPPRGLSPQDQKKLLSTLRNTKGPEAERDYALFHLMLATGIRLTSTLALDVGDVDLNRAEILLRNGKGNRQERVFLGRAICAHIRRYVSKVKSGPLFPGRPGERVTARHARRRLAMWFEEAKISGHHSPHSLRHAFALTLYAKTQNVLVVKQAMHHRSIGSTLVYTRASEAEVRKALA